ncbi:MAG: aminopeptidase, partial [Bacteroidales bacterium]|nr:aminopeptidase [Candidatus Equibacterium intestinale]
MKNIFAATLILLASVTLSAQTKPTIKWPDYKFETVKANPITSVKNQNRSGTCWAYSAIGLVESEIIRINKI